MTKQALDTEPDNLSVIPGTYVVEGENQLLHAILT